MGEHWRRLLRRCGFLLQQANKFVQQVCALEANEQLQLELFLSPRAQTFFKGIIQIYLVACRIVAALEHYQYPTPKSQQAQPSTQELIEQLQLGWSHLSITLDKAGLQSATVAPD